MIRQKKITIKHFLNKKLKALEGENGKEYFPIYTRVTYNRINTIFRFNISEYYDGTSMGNRFDDSAYKEFIESSKGKVAIRHINKVIETIIRLEEDLFKSRFSLKGLGERLGLYESRLASKYLEYVLQPILRAIEENYPNNAVGWTLDLRTAKLLNDALYEIVNVYEDLLKSIPESSIIGVECYSELVIFESILSEPVLKFYHFLTPEFTEAFLKYLLENNYVEKVATDYVMAIREYMVLELNKVL